MGSFSLNGTFTNTPDPDCHPFGTPVRGAFVGGGIVRQGKESAVLNFPPMTSGMFHELYARWAGNKNGLVGGALPKLSGYGWNTVTAAWGEPLPTGWDGPFVHGVAMNVYQIVRY